MELRQLRYFVAVVEEGSFTGASHRLLVAQPGVSAQVRKLEDELGAQLLDRSARSVRPTEAGTAVLARARAAIAAAAEAQEAVDELVGLRRGRVRVGSVPSCPVADLPEMLAGFNREWPEIEISLQEGGSEDLLGEIESGDLDVAVVGTAGEIPAHLGRVELADEALVAAVAADHPLAAVKTTTLARVAEERLVCMPHGTGVRACLDLACAEQNLHPHVALEAGSPALVARLASLGLGVAVIPGSVAAAMPALHTVRFRTRAPRARLELVWRPESLSPAAAALVADLEGQLGTR